MNDFIENLISGSVLNENSSALALAENVDNLIDGDFSSDKLTELLTSNTISESGNDVMKIITAAMQISSENGTLEYSSSSPLESAILSVNTVKQINVSYLVDQGEITAHQVSDMLIDQATVNASVIVETALSEPVIKKGLDSVLDFVSSAYPPLSVAAQCAKQFTPYIASYVSQKVKPAIKEAVTSTSTWLKEASHRVISTCASSAKSVLTKVSAKIVSFFS